MYLKYCMYREEAAAGRDGRVHQCEGLQKREDQDYCERTVYENDKRDWRSGTLSQIKLFLSAWADEHYRRKR